ncbi:MAG: TlpA disulfide reductase family protein [Terriglobales bacterium]
MLSRQLAQIALIAALLLTPSLTFAADEEGQPAPRFHAKTMTGETYTNDNVKGKIVLLEFWTTWCPYCRREQSLVDSIDREFSGKGVVVLAVDVAESKKKVRQYLQDSPRSCRIVLTEDTNLAAMYQANSYPIYVVIDRDGNIAAEQRGAAGERSIRRMLRKAGVETSSEKED